MMKKWPPQVERLRQWVMWECKDIPADLVLSIIYHESGGKIGEPSRATTAAFEVLNDRGEKERVNHAYGLMQCHPALLKTWQDSGQDPRITIDDLRGQDERAARTQITLGCWAYAQQIRNLHEYDSRAFPGHSPGTSTDEQHKLALMAYATGFGKQSPPGGKGLKPRLDELKKRGWDLNAENIVKAFPNWGQRKDGSWWIRPGNAIKRYARYRSVAQSTPSVGTELARITVGPTVPTPPASSPGMTSMTPILSKAGISEKVKEWWPVLLLVDLTLLYKEKDRIFPEQSSDDDEETKDA